MSWLHNLNCIENVVDILLPKISLNTFFVSVSDNIDAQIRLQENEGREFVGGKSFFSLSMDEKDIVIKVEVYYISQEKECRKQEFSGRFLLGRLHSIDQQKFKDMLSKSGKICFEISEPT